MSPTAAMVTEAEAAAAAAPVLPGEAAADGLAGAGCAVAELGSRPAPGGGLRRRPVRAGRLGRGRE
jgi:hypothetical protein